VFLNPLSPRLRETLEAVTGVRVPTMESLGLTPAPVE
jgi:hypothetical protein